MPALRQEQPAGLARQPDPARDLPPLRSVLALAAYGLSALALACHGDGRAQRPSGGERPEGKVDAIPVRTAPAEERTLSELWSTSATLRARRQAMITARSSGVVERIEAEEADWVAEGRVLAELEDDELRIALEKALIAEETRTVEHERAKELHGRGLLADETYELKQREHREARNAAELARLNLSRTRVRAPFAGRILRRLVDVGTTVSVGTEMFELADLVPLEADVNVPEPQVARILPGQGVRITTEAGGVETEGRIVRIAPLVNTGTGTVKVTVAVEPREGLRPGSFVRVQVVTGMREGACVVPRSALVAEGRRWYLFALEPDGEHVARIEVSPGYEERGVVEVLGPAGGESPLKPGRLVVVLGAPALSDGARVSIASEAPEADRERS